MQGQYGEAICVSCSLLDVTREERAQGVNKKQLNKKQCKPY